MNGRFAAYSRFSMSSSSTKDLLIYSTRALSFTITIKFGDVSKVLSKVWPVFRKLSSTLNEYLPSRKITTKIISIPTKLSTLSEKVD